MSFAVPSALHDALPGEESTLALCSRCLSLRPLDAEAGAPAPEPDFQSISDAFPRDAETAVGMALIVGLLDSYALYRAEIQRLVEYVEGRGGDVLLLLDRLEREPGVDASFDVGRRRTQVAQLLE